MYMGVALMAAERHEVYPLGRERYLQGLAHVMHHVAHAPEQRAISGHVDDVGARRDDRVAPQRRISAEKRHDVVVGADRLLLVVGVAGQIGANKARPRPGGCAVRSYFGIA
jgi:hypothetical protein